VTVTYKVLGQLNPSANTLTTIYTVPANTQAVISTITVCNLANAASTFKLAVQPGNAAIDNKHYINYDATLPAFDTVALTLGITLSQTDVVSANVGSANISLNIFGSEIS
jgi:hypothetical protein